MPALLTGLATSAATATTAPKGALGTTATTATTAAADGTTRSTAETTAESATAGPAAATATTAPTTASSGWADLRGLVLRHHGRVRARYTGTAARSLAATRTGHTLALTGARGSTGTLSAFRTMTALSHSLTGGERVISGTRSAGATTGTRTRTGTSAGRQPT